MGGFTSLPPIMAGKKLGLKCFVHDSNALPGKANRLAARYCDKVLLGMEAAKSYFPARPIEITGTPVRDELKALPSREEAAESLGIDPTKKTVLVMGGRQGAKKLNSIVVEASKAMPDTQFIHITGTLDYERVKGELEEAQGHHLIDFCSDMPALYAVTDLAVMRSGASSLTELSYVGIPSILVPFPFAADDHQTFNANAFVEKGAAILAPEGDLDGGTLVAHLTQILENDIELHKMAEATQKLGVKNAAERVCRAIESSF